MEQGADLTMRNLLTEIRNRKHGNMDFKIDDAFGALDHINTKGTSISDQLDASFSNATDLQSYIDMQASIVRNNAGEARSIATPDNIEHLLSQQPGDMTMEQVVETMKEMPEDSSLDRAYAQEMSQRLTETVYTEESVIEMLSANEEPISYYSLMAARNMLTSRNRLFNEFTNAISEDGNVDFDAIKQAILEKLGESVKAPEEMAEAQRVLAETAEKASENYLPDDSDLTSMDLRDLKMMRTELMLTASFAKNEQYAIPVMVEGEAGTVHLQIVRGDDSKGRVNIVLENDSLGKIAAELADMGDRIEGLIISSSE